MKATMDGAIFNRLIGAVRNFATKSEARPQYQLIQLKFYKEDCKAVSYAIDGYRAAKESVVCFDVDEDFSVMVSAPSLKASAGGGVEIEKGNGFAYISFGDVRFRTKQPDTEFFDCEKVISESMERELNQKVGANVDFLLDALKSLKASGATSRKPVIIEFRGQNDPIILRTDKDNPKMVLPMRIRTEAND